MILWKFKIFIHYSWKLNFVEFFSSNEILNDLFKSNQFLIFSTLLDFFAY